MSGFKFRLFSVWLYDLRKGMCCVWDVGFLICIVGMITRRLQLRAGDLA